MDALKDALALSSAPDRGWRAPRTLSRRGPRAGSMTENAFALMAATVATNALGLAFWALAARISRVSMLGRASAEIAALLLLSTLAQLSLSNLFLRFLPVAGHLTQRFVLRAYGTVILVALALSIGYVTSGAGSGVVPHTTGAECFFVVGVALLALFALQDAVLTALRVARWVTVENTAFAVGKLALLPFVALGVSGLAIAWVMPAAVAVFVVNVVLFARVFPSLEQREGRLPSLRRVLSLMAAEHSVTLCSTAATQVLPLIVLWRLGPAANAYFVVPWFAWTAISLLFWNTGASFIVDAVSAEGVARRSLRRALALGAGIVAVSLIACLLLAEPVLRILGATYAQHGATLLRLIGLSSPLFAVTVLYASVAWLDQRIWRLVGIEVATGALLIGLSALLLPRLGLAAIGWANLVTQGVAAACMAPTVVSRLRLWDLAGRGARSATNAADPR